MKKIDRCTIIRKEYSLAPVGVNVMEDMENLIIHSRLCVSVNFKLDHPPGDTLGFARSHCPGGRVFAQHFLPEGRGFELEKFSTVLKEKCRNFSICFKETRGSFAKAGVLVQFHIDFCKNSKYMLYL